MLCLQPAHNCIQDFTDHVPISSGLWCAVHSHDGDVKKCPREMVWPLANGYQFIVLAAELLPNSDVSHVPLSSVEKHSQSACFSLTTLLCCVIWKPFNLVITFRVTFVNRDSTNSRLPMTSTLHAPQVIFFFFGEEDHMGPMRTDGKTCQEYVHPGGHSVPAHLFQGAALS